MMPINNTMVASDVSTTILYGVQWIVLEWSGGNVGIAKESLLSPRAVAAVPLRAREARTAMKMILTQRLEGSW